MDRQKEEIVFSNQVGANDFCDSKISHQRKKRKILIERKDRTKCAYCTYYLQFNTDKLFIEMQKIK
jgi:hypothetical protein